MKAYVKAPEKMSRAMFRVANALERHRPDGVDIVQHEDEADLLVHHVIGLEAVTYRESRPCAVLQYCVNSATREGSAPWHPLWARARAVWSYYDLQHMMPEGARFYYAPMAIDPIFRIQYSPQVRTVGVLTSGYVSGHGQEAIEEATIAAQNVGLKTIHLGPVPEGLERLNSLEITGPGIPDSKLAAIYGRTKWVSGLRFVEGFEMGACEGLAQGARPVMFDRPEARAWFGDHAVFVPECSGDELIAHLERVFSTEPAPVTEGERATVLAKFNWKTAVAGFWREVMR